MWLYVNFLGLIWDHELQVITSVTVHVEYYHAVSCLLYLKKISNNHFCVIYAIYPCQPSVNNIGEQ